MISRICHSIWEKLLGRQISNDNNSIKISIDGCVFYFGLSSKSPTILTKVQNFTENRKTKKRCNVFQSLLAQRRTSTSPVHLLDPKQEITNEITYHNITKECEYEFCIKFGQKGCEISIKTLKFLEKDWTLSKGTMARIADQWKREKEDWQRERGGEMSGK